ncbi:MAG TPA: adenylate/guanylate cyclase domain-containing protein [Dongiaceae bacterium]
MNKAWGIAIPGLLLIGAAALRVSDPAPIQNLRNLVFDAFQRLAPRPYDPQLPVRIAAIDEKSLDKFGQWPWSRATMAKVVDRLHELGAAVIAFDVLFAEPDRTAPKAVAAALPDDPTFTPIKAEMAALPDPDQMLADSLKRVTSVVPFAYLASDPGRVMAPLQKKYDIIAQRTDANAAEEAAGFALGGDYYVPSLPALQAAATGIGAVNAGEPDPDGIIRQVPLVVRVKDKLYPSLATEALYRGVGGNTPFIKLAGAPGAFSFGASTGAAKMRIGTVILQPTARVQLFLYDTGHQPKRFVSIADLFRPDFDANLIAGQIVLIGTTVEGLQDIKATPLDAVMPGVEIHAQIIEQIASGKYLTRPDWADGAEILTLIGLGVVAIGFSYGGGALSGLLVALITIIVSIALSWYYFKDQHWLLDPLYPAGTAVVLFIATTLINFLRTEHEKRFIRSAMSRYVSPALVNKLSPENLKLGGELRELTLMFTDIRGFTKLSEKLNPQELTHVINAFLTPMTDVILKHSGAIDKYIGDCIMAFWNAPIDIASHGKLAIQSAFLMREELAALNARLKHDPVFVGLHDVEIKAGIGLNSGLCCVGNMGSDQRFNYSALGDTVNTASRLEALSPAYGVDLVIGEETASAAPEFALLELDQVQVKGKAVPVRIYTGLGDEHVAATAEFRGLKEGHDRMLTAYRGQDWDRADAAVRACAEQAPESLLGLYEVYAARIAEFRADPPPADWDGVYIAKSKTG